MADLSLAHLEVDVSPLNVPTATLGQRLAALRRAAGLSQQQLAGPSGIVSASMISLIEAGKRTPGPAVVAHLAAQLGVPVAHLQPTAEITAGAPPTPSSPASGSTTWRVTIRATVPSHEGPPLTLPQQTHDVQATTTSLALVKVAALLRRDALADTSTP